MTNTFALPFLKMHGIGNDFVAVDCLRDGAPNAETLQKAAVFLCDRRFGIGGDGVLLALPAASADFMMRMFNPDGSEAEMCGNGIRCIGKFLYEAGYAKKSEVAVETLGGVKVLQLGIVGGAVTEVTVDMGKPGLDRSDLPMLGNVGRVIDEPLFVDGEPVAITGVSMGNPHAIFFVEKATEAIINHLGPKIENHPLFPRRTNVHAVQVHNRGEITMLTWERGAGRTLACGTGACASMVASVLNGHTDDSVLVHLAGGDLSIKWNGEGASVSMRGAADTVFSGTVSIPV